MNDFPKASYAVDPAVSRGRLHPEAESAHRSPYQRDRDRIIHSTGFRRLKHKTQVFVEHEGDYYRTRMTHSIEVAQIARTVARALDLNEDLAEAVALAHDLGHPPFGHAGERALNLRMAPHGGFDHNAQALKIVTGLEGRYAEFDGLNLTWETLEGIAKHNGPLISAPDSASGDVSGGGLHFVIADYVARHDLELWTRASAEAQVAALADDIAYNNHDLDDGLRAGLFAAADLRNLPLVGASFAEVAARYPGLDEGRLHHEALRRVFGLMVEDVIVESAARLARAAPADAAAVRAMGAPAIAFSKGMAEAVRALQQFLFKRMYRHYKVNRMMSKARRVVEELFVLLVAEPGLLPDEWRESASQPSSETLRARVVADYIAGMTDRYALEEHRKLTDPHMKA